MTAHRQKPTITPDRVQWFANYYADNPAWGEFHVVLDDGNYHCEAGPYHTDPKVVAEIRASWPADLREHAEWFDTLTPSQKRRLGKKAEALAGDPFDRYMARRRGPPSPTNADGRAESHPQRGRLEKRPPDHVSRPTYARGLTCCKRKTPTMRSPVRRLSPTDTWRST